MTSDGGYTPYKAEAVAHSQEGPVATTVQADPVESFVMLPHNCSDHFQQSLPLSWRYCQQMQQLLHHLHEITTSSLHLPGPDFFRKYYDSSVSDAEGIAAPSYSLRLAFYPRQREDADSATACSGSNGTRQCRYMGGFMFLVLVTVCLLSACMSQVWPTHRLHGLYHTPR